MSLRLSLIPPSIITLLPSFFSPSLHSCLPLFFPALFAPSLLPFITIFFPHFIHSLPASTIPPSLLSEDGRWVSWKADRATCVVASLGHSIYILTIQRWSLPCHDTLVSSVRAESIPYIYISDLSQDRIPNLSNGWTRFSECNVK